MVDRSRPRGAAHSRFVRGRHSRPTCVARVRAQGGRIAGKTNLHELAFGVTGVNPWYGTPPNPADPGRVPGGSSSGSAAAVALGETDVALGTDTAGSVRIPAACCGVVGLRPPTDGFRSTGYGRSREFRHSRAVGKERRRHRPRHAPSRTEFRAGRETRRRGRPDRIQRTDRDRPGHRGGHRRGASLGRTGRAIRSYRRLGTGLARSATLVGVKARVSNAALFDDDPAQTVGSDTLQRFRDSDVPSEIASSAKKRGDQWSSMFRKTVERLGVLALPTLARRPPSSARGAGGCRFSPHRSVSPASPRSPCLFLPKDAHPRAFSSSRRRGARTS